MIYRHASAIGYGGMLGAANTLFIAIAMGVYTHDDAAPAVFVFLIGLIPGLLTGMVLGVVAGATARCNAWLRRALLAGPAIALVALLAKTFGVVELIAPAVIPTLVCVLILERKTRYVASIPVATVRY